MFVPTSTLFSLVLALPLVLASAPPAKRQESTSTPPSTSTTTMKGDMPPPGYKPWWDTNGDSAPVRRANAQATPTGSSNPEDPHIKRTEIPEGYEPVDDAPPVNDDEPLKRAEGQGAVRLIAPDYTLFEFPAPHDDLNCHSNQAECHPDLKFNNEWKDQVFDVKQFGLDPNGAGGVEASDVDFTTRSATKIVQCTAKVDVSPTETFIFEPRMTDPWPQEEHKGAGHLTCTLASTATAAATPVRR